MNNKSLIILLVLTVFLVTGCKETHNRAIDIAYQLTATAPDSALSVLNGVNQAKLGKVDMARYALVYTIAQDKSKTRSMPSASTTWANTTCSTTAQNWL